MIWADNWEILNEFKKQISEYCTLMSSSWTDIYDDWLQRFECDKFLITWSLTFKEDASQIFVT